MTKSEAATLRQGQSVQTFHTNKWRVVLVSRVTYWGFDSGQHKAGDVCYVYVRRPGLTKGGFRFPANQRTPEQLRSVITDVLACNVMADWLEDHNFPEAAMALRKAFPSASGQE